MCQLDQSVTTISVEEVRGNRCGAAAVFARRYACQSIGKQCQVSRSLLCFLASNNISFSVAFHSTQNDWTLAFNLCEKLENVKMVYVAILTDIFGGSMHPSTLEFVKSRIGKTIDFCGFSSIACDMIVMFKHEKTFACIANMLRPLLSSDRFQVQNVQLRNIFRGIVGAVAPQQTQELLSLVETKFVFIRIRRALKGDWESIGDDPVKILNFMKVLIDNFVSVKDLLGKELFGDVRSKFAAERAVIAGSDRLRERDAQALGQLLASYLQGYTFVWSGVLEGGKQLSLPVVYGDAENLMHIVKVCAFYPLPPSLYELTFCFTAHCQRRSSPSLESAILAAPVRARSDGTMRDQQRGADAVAKSSLHGGYPLCCERIRCCDGCQERVCLLFVGTN